MSLGRIKDEQKFDGKTFNYMTWSSLAETVPFPLSRNKSSSSSMKFHGDCCCLSKSTPDEEFE